MKTCKKLLSGVKIPIDLQRNVGLDYVWEFFSTPMLFTERKIYTKKLLRIFLLK